MSFTCVVTVNVWLEATTEHWTKLSMSKQVRPRLLI